MKGAGNELIQAFSEALLAEGWGRPRENGAEAITKILALMEWQKSCRTDAEEMRFSVESTQAARQPQKFCRSHAKHFWQ